MIRVIVRGCLKSLEDQGSKYGVANNEGSNTKLNKTMQCPLLNVFKKGSSFNLSDVADASLNESLSRLELLLFALDRSFRRS